MNFEPQVPDWGEKLTFNKLDLLIKYHNWLCTTGIRAGLISPKSEQFIWDEFIIHSIYFGKLITEMPNSVEEISDLGTGGGIPGVPIGLTTDINVNLIDIKEKRVFELSRLLRILNKKNMFSLQENAEDHIKRGGFFVSRCFISSENVINSIKKDKKTTYLVSSTGEELEYDTNVFHVKHEKFKINKNDIRHIDVINVK